uniref:Sodium/potassium-transporting ATPase subunit beta n=1 Tax=Myripristis murdjan TaxID=586833 RepID=A0A667ZBE2_9TELE
MASTEDKAVDKENVSNWKDSIYNPRTGELLGRTASSWGLILLFYLIFYCFLAGMFALTMWVMLLTLDEYTPKYRDRVPHPGLVIRPNSVDIWVNISDPEKYKTAYVKPLESFLESYNDTEQEKNKLCFSGEYFEQEDNKMEKEACQFKRSLLSSCSGLSDTTFGYGEGQPCVLLKMNRVTPPFAGLEPSALSRFLCFLLSHLSLSLFPSLTQGNYVQPLVAVKLLVSPEDYGTEMTIECRVDGSDIRNNDDRDKFLGRVTFRVKVFK